MKCLTDQFQLCFFCIGNIKCSRDYNLQDQGLVETSRPRLHQNFRDLKFENETSSQVLKFVHFAESFQKNVVTTSQVEFFRSSHIIPICFHCFFPANTTEKKFVELQFYQAIFLQYSESQNNRLVTETCSLWDRDSQSWAFRRFL